MQSEKAVCSVVSQCTIQTAPSIGGETVDVDRVQAMVVLGVIGLTLTLNGCK